METVDPKDRKAQERKEGLERFKKDPTPTSLATRRANFVKKSKGI